MLIQDKLLVKIIFVFSSFSNSSTQSIYHEERLSILTRYEYCKEEIE